MSDKQTEILRITGSVTTPSHWSYSDLRQILSQESDLSTLGARWPYGGLPLIAVGKIVKPDASVNRIRLCSSADNFERTVPWQAVRDVGWIVYRHGEQPLDRDQGGPVRLWISGHTPCGITELDTCVNIKFLDTLEFLTGASHGEA